MTRSYPLLVGSFLFVKTLSASSSKFELTQNVDQHPIVIKKKLILVNARVDNYEAQLQDGTVTFIKALGKGKN